MSHVPQNLLGPSTQDAHDMSLVARVLEGERMALDELVERHQPFIYNIALKMFGDRADAEDLTQEVLIKILTALKTFRVESSFRTWVYRITVNHFLKTRRRGLESSVATFDRYFDDVARVTDEPMSPHELEIAGATVTELRIRCTTGMLMCLDRQQRVVFILGALFDVPHTLGGEILGLSPGNFRVRLHRARADLYSWMNQRCGLVNASNPCRCEKKTRGYQRQGILDPERLVFNADYTARIGDVVQRGATRAMETVDDLHEQLFREHPFAGDGLSVVDALLKNETLRAFFDLS